MTLPPLHSQGRGVGPIRRAFRAPARGTAAFTMVEIALSIAVVAFALVAILGVLPSGLQVQRDNREDTIINQEGSLWLEAIRAGVPEFPKVPVLPGELTNYVDSLTLKTRRLNSIRPPITYSNLYDREILGLLSYPKVTLDADGKVITNSVSAKVRALTGPAMDKPPGRADVTFRYLLTAEIVPLYSFPPDLKDQLNPKLPDVTRLNYLENHTHEIRLILQWPLLPDGPGGATRVGDHTRIFRAVVSGRLFRDPNDQPPGRPQPLYFFQPATYAK